MALLRPGQGPLCHDEVVTGRDVQRENILIPRAGVAVYARSARRLYQRIVEATERIGRDGGPLDVVVGQRVVRYVPASHRAGDQVRVLAARGMVTGDRPSPDLTVGGDHVG